MTVQTDRLLSLIEFAQQAARMRSKPATSVSDHGLFSLHEHAFRGLPGIRLNAGDDSSDETWLSVDRLHETKPPTVGPLLLPWIESTQSPTEPPSLKRSCSGASLIAAETHTSAHERAQEGKDVADPEAYYLLEDYARAEEVRGQFARYVAQAWQRWSEDEANRRRTIRLYAQLFTLKQQLEGGIVEAQLELVWGVGVGIWATGTATVSYPLVARLVELSLDSESGEIRIRPRDVDARLQLDWYASVDNPGVATLDRVAAEFFAKSTTTFSPFDRGSFEPVLRAASTHLDANGTYWPDVVAPDDRALPRADAKLKVTDTWVLFARPRTNSIFIQDLDKLKAASAAAVALPPAVAAIVTDPATSSPTTELPSFRGVSASFGVGAGGGQANPRDLYFPKPYNDEQVRIVQLLESSDGVVVQGPPGTGKTHTIANVICHYLAEGKRVLVTSMKDAALGVLQEKLPPEIRPLTIALLASEQDGMKQFEHAIQKIASEVQSLDKAATARQIKHLDEAINALHARLASIDRSVADWARLNLSQVHIDGEDIAPLDAAREVVAGEGQYEWLSDQLTVGAEHAPQVVDQDMVRLREARRALGIDIDYLDSSLPQMVDFPSARELIALHQDLSRLAILTEQLEAGVVPELAADGETGVAGAGELLGRVDALRAQNAEVEQAGVSWSAALRERLRSGAHAEAFALLERLTGELEHASTARTSFLRRPVSAPPGLEADAEIVGAVANLAAGRSPFGLRGLVGKADQKRRVAAVRVLGTAPNDSESWRHVGQFLSLQTRLRELAMRWNALVGELKLNASVSVDADGGLEAFRSASVYRKLKNAVTMEGAVGDSARVVFPRWQALASGATDGVRLNELADALNHHILRARLSGVWAKREQVAAAMVGRSGRVVDQLRDFFRSTLGNRAILDSDMQVRWTGLISELVRVSELASHLAVVRDVSDRIAASGAPKWAARLRTPMVGPVDDQVPDRWRAAWRLRRIATHLGAIESQHELQRRAVERREAEADLKQAYRDVIAKRTWLKLASNASPSIRAALQAYLNAIQKIGKGTGKRASRFRADARSAATLANPAVPCWIMAHYRVSESLPAELGCFDLVIIDEASQSDLSALPALLRAKKVLIVGDDKQVSPEGVGLEEEKVRNLMTRFLSSQVPTYRMQMSPERSIYDLYKVVFAESGVMLKEHFRCVGPIIEYSKREHYNHELRPLRLPRASERLDPPLVDVLVKDGYRDGDENAPEARFIVDEIARIAADPKLSTRTIGVVSLLADKQALRIWTMIAEELGPELIERHDIACGDARTFQGKERDIMFLSMVIAPNVRSGVSSRDTFAQRYNVAASRARDRMYLVRSVEATELSQADDLRRRLLSHFTAPFAQDVTRVEDLRVLCESPFEREMYDELVQRGYRVTPQVRVGQYRIDLVIEGLHDARLAVECDGDRYHGVDKWADDMRRQRDLERAGWTFWRCFASTFVRRRREVIEDLERVLKERSIDPLGAEGAPRSVHSERRDVTAFARSGEPVTKPESAAVSDEVVAETVTAPSTEAARSDVETRLSKSQTTMSFAPAQSTLSIADVGRGGAMQTRLESDGESDPRIAHLVHRTYSGRALSDPRSVEIDVVADGLVEIVRVEGPVLARRAYDVYLANCGIKRLGHELKSTMNKAIARALRDGRLEREGEDEGLGYVSAIVRLRGSQPVVLRSRGSRSFEEIPPSELKALGDLVAALHGIERGSESHQRAVLQFYDLKRLTKQVNATLVAALGRGVEVADE